MRRWVFSAGLLASACSFTPLPGGVPSDATRHDAPVGSDAAVDAPPDSPVIEPACATSSEYQPDPGNPTHHYLYVNTMHVRDDAFDTCAAQGAHLVTIDDLAENAFVATLTGSDDANVWIGYDDLVTEGAFTWVAGSASTFTDWGAGEPDNGSGGKTGHEDCAYILPAGQLNQWNDTNCGDMRTAVCECETGYTPPPTKRCMSQGGWTLGDGRRYQLNTTKLTWAAAETACEANDAYLVVVSDSDEDSLLKSTIKITDSTWIGLSRPTQSDPFVWIDGAAFGSSSWKSGQPTTGEKDCVYANNGDGTWENHTCTETHASVCECDPDPPIAP